LSSSKDEIVTLKENSQHLQSALSSKEDEFLSLQREHSAALSDLQEILLQAEAKVNDLSLENDRLVQGEIPSLLEQILELKSSIAKKEIELQSHFSSQIDELEMQLNTSKLDKLSAESSVDKLRAEVAGLQNQLASSAANVGDNLKKLQKQIVDLQSELADSQSEVDQLSAVNILFKYLILD